MSLATVLKKSSISSLRWNIKSNLIHSKSLASSYHLCQLTQQINGWQFTRHFQTGYKLNQNLQATSQVKPEEPKEFSEVPGPWQFPVIGSIPAFIRNNFDSTQFHLFHEKMFEKYGPIVTFKMPMMPTFVLLKNPDDLQTLLEQTMDNPVRMSMNSLKKVRENSHGIQPGQGGLLIENEEEWWRLRSRVQGPILKPKKVLQYLPLVDEATVKFMDRIDLLQEESGRVPDDFIEELYKWALECVGLVALDKKLGCLEPNLSPDSTPMQMIENINIMFKSLNKTEFDIPWWKLYKTEAFSNLEKAHSSFIEVAEDSITKAIESLEQSKADGGAVDRPLTLIEALLQTQGLSKSDIITMILDMLMAGVDTTSHTVAFTLYLLAKHPEVQRNLQAEVDEVLGESISLQPEHINRMRYLTMVMKESYRLYPVGTGIGRNPTKEIVLSGYKIPPGCFVLSSVYAMGRSEELFPRSKEFIPERWSKDRPLGAIHHYASLPFSHGTRMCVGKRLAEQEINNLIIRVMQKYSVTYESDQEMTFKTQLVLKPTSPLAFKFHPR